MAAGKKTVAHQGSRVTGTGERLPVIAVVGGGFGGSYAIRELLRRRGKRRFRIILFEPRARFVFTPLLHEVATAGLETEHATVPYAALFPPETLEFRRERVTAIDAGKRHVVTADGVTRYDRLILATGATTNFYGNEAARQIAFSLKDDGDALRIRFALEQALLDAAQRRSPVEQRQLLSVIVVGGGPTGVELVAEIAQFFRYRIRKQYPMIARDAPCVTLVQATQEILPGFSVRFRKAALKGLERLGIGVKAGLSVTNVLKSGVVCENQQKETVSLRSSLTVWVAGITPAKVPLSPDSAGQRCYVTGQDLAVNGLPGAFALGDAAMYDPALKLPRTPALAQAAVQQAAVVAENILASMDGKKTRTFVYRSRGTLVSLGQRNAVGELSTPLGTLFLNGFFAWWLWRTVYLFKFLDAKQQARSAATWTARLFTRRSAAAPEAAPVPGRKEEEESGNEPSRPEGSGFGRRGKKPS